jgi:hypothetical protein
LKDHLIFDHRRLEKSKNRRGQSRRDNAENFPDSKFDFSCAALIGGSLRSWQKKFSATLFHTKWKEESRVTR